MSSNELINHGTSSAVDGSLIYNARYYIPNLRSKSEIDPLKLLLK